MRLKVPTDQSREPDKATGSPSMPGPRHGSRILPLKGTPRIRGAGRTRPNRRLRFIPAGQEQRDPKREPDHQEPNLRIEHLRRVMTSESVSPPGGHPQHDRGNQDHHQQAEITQQGPGPFLSRAPYVHVPSVPVPPSPAHQTSPGASPQRRGRLPRPRQLYYSCAEVRLTRAVMSHFVRADEG